ncbi:MAG: GNAT family N-acetyltransferase [Christensenellaceae bacterium]|jgi:GNAT superfamily N-acetyltransferase|nr:GNAT family N-acetyltransferase [Christensenellaceae bacterium]
MKIVDFAPGHIERAALLARQSYDEERALVPPLPEAPSLPSLEGYAREGRGVAALDGGELLGFLCWDEPQEGRFGRCRGAWSPLHAHGAALEGRGEIYGRLYQAAAGRLVAERVFSHTITLYAHDEAAIFSFFQNGFGCRCVDAMRETHPVAFAPRAGLRFRQATLDDAAALARMRNEVDAHLHASPIFMPSFSHADAQSTAEEMKGGGRQYFLALLDGGPAAFFRLQEGGENFAANEASVANLSGAYTLPALRGRGVATGLLAFVMDELRGRGIARCGVDFESLNPAGRKFWQKHFGAYTAGLARRIDERISG